MPPSIRIRRLCDRLHFLADVMDRMRGAPSSPSSLDECIAQLEANAMLIEHQLNEQSPAIATVLPARPSPSCRAVLLKFPSPCADTAPHTQFEETSPCAVDSP
jgi:hypothetical protein